MDMGIEELRLHVLRLAAEIAKEQPADKVLEVAQKLLAFVQR